MKRINNKNIQGFLKIGKKVKTSLKVKRKKEYVGKTKRKRVDIRLPNREKKQIKWGKYMEIMNMTKNQSIKVCVKYDQVKCPKKYNEKEM